MKYKYYIAGKRTLTKALEILNTVAKAVDEGAYFISFEKLKRETYYLQGDPRRLSNNIYSIERSGYIKIDRKSKSVELTNKGRIKLLENSDDNKIDGKWRFLSWDIPEELRNKRQHFCASIKRLGYRQVQKSLWASPFIKSSEVYIIADELGIRKYVALIVSDSTDIENHLKKLFSKELP